MSSSSEKPTSTKEGGSSQDEIKLLERESIFEPTAITEKRTLSAAVLINPDRVEALAFIGFHLIESESSLLPARLEAATNGRPAHSSRQ
ncbi:uncharacterized protein PV07_08619 [Cladophialophora immunda]|uniref:Uncharacterized protein n=1 Tax=Cladophialophora immunda TaxID=569365 RepID=A0A0D1ZCI7_9EURO|nr:uncharacterized protein PV07_08619 [Cladophialophora immunda]KIW25446.1 hypothetical protein PV07_08619 [Cladophialophora immunda]